MLISSFFTTDICVSESGSPFLTHLTGSCVRVLVTYQFKQVPHVRSPAFLHFLRPVFLHSLKPFYSKKTEKLRKDL